MRKVVFNMGFKKVTFNKLKIGGKERETISGKKDSTNTGKEEEHSS